MARRERSAAKDTGGEQDAIPPTHPAVADLRESLGAREM
jgi:hypothetical protein